LKQFEKGLVWIAGRDVETLSQRLGGLDDVTVLEQHTPIEELMVASDVVVTKANRGTIDAASLGLPSVSLSYGTNPIDEAIIPRIRSNVAIDARGIDGAFLAKIIADIVLGPGKRIEPSDEYRSGGAEAVAQALADFFGRAGFCQAHTPDIARHRQLAVSPRVATQTA